MFEYGFSLNSLFTICPLETKKGENFLFLGLECIFKPVKWFLFQNSQMGNLLVFYICNILVDKNTLCNGCFLTGLSVYSKSSCNMDSVLFHAMCWSQVSRICPWRFHAISKSKQSVRVQRPDASQCLEASALHLSGQPSYTVRTLGQATPSSTWS
jgi:hypothetical protein